MARVKKGYVETSDLKSVRSGRQYSVVNAAAEMENGMLVKVGDFVDTENRAASFPAAADKVALLADVALSYESGAENNMECYYTVEAGKPARAYEIEADDRFKVSTNLIKLLGAAPVVGNFVVAGENGKYAESATAVEGAAFVGKILAYEDAGSLPLVTVLVKKNA